MEIEFSILVLVEGLLRPKMNIGEVMANPVSILVLVEGLLRPGIIVLRF